MNKFSFVFFVAHFMYKFARLNRFCLQFAYHFYALQFLAFFSLVYNFFRVNAHLYGKIVVIFDVENLSKKTSMCQIIIYDLVFFGCIFFFCNDMQRMKDIK